MIFLLFFFDSCICGELTPRLASDFFNISTRLESPRDPIITIISCKFISYHVAAHGGAIYSIYEEQVITIKESYFFDCSVIGWTGGAIFTIVKELFIEDSNFSSCYTNLNCAGALLFKGETTKVSRCQFIGCYSGRDGAGAIWITLANEAIFLDCRFESCFSKANNGGVFIFQDTISVIFLGQNIFVGNYAPNRGGAIFGTRTTNFYADEGITFIENYAKDGSLVSFDSDMNDFTLRIQNLTLSPNIIQKSLIFMPYKVGNLTLANFNVDSNLLNFNSVFYFTKECTNVLIENNTFIKLKSAISIITFTLQCQNIILSNNVFINCTGKTGVVDMELVSNAFVTNCLFEGNYCVDKGGALYTAKTNNITFTDCTFKSNSAVNTGGALFLNIVENLDFEGINIFSGNFANVGGIIYIDLAPPVVNLSSIDCDETNYAILNANLFHINRALKTFEVSNIRNIARAPYQFPVIYFANKCDNIIIQNCTFSGCNRQSSVFSIADIVNTTVIDCTFEDNLNGDAGALYILNCLYVNLLNCNFTRNKANSLGGVIRLLKALELNIEDCNFINNTASLGGVFHLVSPKVNLRGFNFFDGNIAFGSHGAIFVFAGAINNLILEYPSFQAGNLNTARDVGSIGYFIQKVNTVYLDGISYTNPKAFERSSMYFEVSPENVTLINCTFCNITGESGIAFRSVANTLIVRNCTFRNNRAVNNHNVNGGGIALDRVNHIYISDVIFTNNYALNVGGALYINTPDFVIAGHNYFDGNWARDGGSFYFNTEKYPLLDFSDSIFGPKCYSTAGSAMVKIIFMAGKVIFKNIFWEAPLSYPTDPIGFANGAEELILENITIINSTLGISPVNTPSNLKKLTAVDVCFRGCKGTKPFFNIENGECANITRCSFYGNTVPTSNLVVLKVQRFLSRGRFVFENNNIPINDASCLFVLQVVDNVAPIKFAFQTAGIVTRFMRISGNSNQIMIYKSSFENLNCNFPLFDVSDITLYISTSNFSSILNLPTTAVNIIRTTIVKAVIAPVHLYIADSKFSGFVNAIVIYSESNFTSLIRCKFLNSTGCFLSSEKSSEVKFHDISVSNLTVVNNPIIKVSNAKKFYLSSSSFNDIKTGSTCFSTKSLQEFKVDNCKFANISSSGYGSAIQSMNSMNMTVNDCVFKGLEFGCLYIANDGAKPGLNNSVFTGLYNNQFFDVKTKLGGSIIINNTNGEIEILNATIVNTSSENGGGAIRIENVIGFVVLSFDIENSSTKEIGGAIFIKNVTYIEVISSSLYNCDSMDGGGGFFISNSPKVIINGVNISHCVSHETYGGGIYVVRSDEVLLNNCSFSYCKSYYEGGALLVSSDIQSHSITNSTFSYCESRTGGAAAIKCRKNFTLFRTIFRENSGPALHMFCDDFTTIISIDRCCFSGNRGKVPDIFSNFNTPISFGKYNSFDNEMKYAIRIDSMLDSPIEMESFNKTECDIDFDYNKPPEPTQEFTQAQNPYQRKHKILKIGFALHPLLIF